MLHWVTRYGYASTMARLFDSPAGRSLRHDTAFHSIERVLHARSLPRGVWILADLERYGPGERTFLAAVADHLEGAGQPVLNHPRRALTRHDLLTTLHDHGINPFRSHRRSTVPSDVRWPVILRSEREHRPLTLELLDDLEAVDRVIAAEGVPGDEHLLIEFEDTRDHEGRFEKRGSLRVGSQLLAATLTISEHWHVKYVEPTKPDERDRQLAYIEDNGDAETLLPVFGLAGIEYGRVDYSPGRDGRPVIWEINTNPALVMPRPGAAVLPHRAEYFRRTVDAYQALQRPEAGAPVRLDVPADLRRAARADALAWFRRRGAAHFADRAGKKARLTLRRGRR